MIVTFFFFSFCSFSPELKLKLEKCWKTRKDWWPGLVFRNPCSDDSASGTLQRNKRLVQEVMLNLGMFSHFSSILQQQKKSYKFSLNCMAVWADNSINLCCCMSSAVLCQSLQSVKKTIYIYIYLLWSNISDWKFHEHNRTADVHLYDKFSLLLWQWMEVKICLCSNTGHWAWLCIFIRHRYAEMDSGPSWHISSLRLKFQISKVTAAINSTYQIINDLLYYLCIRGS